MSIREDVRAQGIGVGSRVSWGAILAGVVVAFAVHFLLNLLGTAIGLSVFDQTARGAVNAGAALWSIVAVCLALFLGGWVTSRFTLGEDRLEAGINGAIVWGVSFLLMLWVVSIGLGLSYGNLLLAVRSPGGMVDQNTAVITQEAAARAAWWALAGTLLSMVAAIGGAIVGTQWAYPGFLRFQQTSLGETRGPT